MKTRQIIHVATAYWCEDAWVIAAGYDEARVKGAAEAYVLAHNGREFTSRGNFKHPDENGRAAEGYYMEAILET